MEDIDLHINVVNSLLYKYHKKLSLREFLEEFDVIINNEYIYKLSKEYILIDEDMVINFKGYNMYEENKRLFFNLLNKNDIHYSEYDNSYYISFALKNGLPIPLKKQNKYIVMKKDNYIKALMLCKKIKNSKFVKIYKLYNEYMCLKNSD